MSCRLKLHIFTNYTSDVYERYLRSPNAANKERWEYLLAHESYDVLLARCAEQRLEGEYYSKLVACVEDFQNVNYDENVHFDIIDLVDDLTAIAEKDDIPINGKSDGPRSLVGVSSTLRSIDGIVNDAHAKNSPRAFLYLWRK